jgi:serine/threonine protein kinase
MAAHINTPPPAIVRRDDLPPSLVRIIMKCLSKDPAGRHQSANELLADIESVATPSDTLHSASPMRPTRVLAGVGAVAALIALGWFGTAGIRHERWMRTDAIPRIKQYLEVEQ